MWYIAGGSKVVEWGLIWLLIHKSRRLPGQPARLPGRRSNHLLTHLGRTRKGRSDQGAGQ
jgi:hypothetical protein